ncbi:response regulator transcription factor [Sinanaerobacter chloroacetimidivorans]|jgi:DNA-binding response OmpR family regulator|uniref:Stage 0 sporulation protein A homolog n=1 Tax=Sinanaerobacter chloroacetimidivorans TaxID=2818044 RepID=A0A8J7W4D9_9FIRM|nr:response regulator transcription factor [Sinanaerobacter chloroacetimidivorans]MBR0598908.1 response regulator transcription factor [Sinanaerobacter chloroacetimidivorans]
MVKKVLIVDDEKPINDLIRSYLVKEGFTPLSAYTGEEALELVKKEKPDFIILDIMLPDMEGIDLCLEIRKTNNSPILFLSCKSEEIDKIVALSVGGDDYMTKPFLPGELIARIKAHLRRQKSVSQNEQTIDEDRYELEGLIVNMQTHEVIADGQPVNLTAKEFDILQLLMKNPKRIFSADQIFELTWKTNHLEGDSRTVMVYISTLRKKLEINPNNPKYIINIRGVGYKFNHQLLES